MPKWHFDDATEEFKGDDLYFIREDDSGPIKIGRGTTMHRLRRLQTGNPRTLVLVGVMPNCGYQEAFWHELFGHRQMRGEWFEPAVDLRKAIREALAGREWAKYAEWWDESDDREQVQEALLDAAEVYDDRVFAGAPEKRAATSALWDCVMHGCFGMGEPTHPTGPKDLIP